MHPTPMQVFCNVEFFTQALTDAGVEAAHAKLVSLTRHIGDLRALQGWLDLFQRELRGTQQSPHRWPSKRNTPTKENTQMLKRAGPQKKTVLHYRQKCNELETKILKKIAQWPSLEYDPEELSSTFDKHKVKKRMKKRASRLRFTFQP